MKVTLLCMLILVSAAPSVRAQQADQPPNAIDFSTLSLIGEALGTPPSPADVSNVMKGSQLISDWRKTHSEDWNKIVSSGNGSYEVIAELSVWPTPADGKAFVLALIRTTTLSGIISSGDQVLQNYVSEYDQLKKLTDAVSVIRNELPPLKIQVGSLSTTQKNSIIAAASAFSAATK